MGVHRLQGVLQHGDLGVLASETQDGSAGHIGVVDVARDEIAEHLRVLPRASAAGIVHQEFHPIHILKHAVLNNFFLFQDYVRVVDAVFRGAFLVFVDEQLEVDVVLRFSGIPQALAKYFFELQDVSVFTENQRNHYPHVLGTHLAVGAMVAHKSLVLPLGDIRLIPPRVANACIDSIRRIVMNIFYGNGLSPGNIFIGFTHNHSVHVYLVPFFKILTRKFMFLLDVVFEDDLFSLYLYYISFPKVFQRHYQVICGVEYDCSLFHCSILVIGLIVNGFPFYNLNPRISSFYS